MCLALSRTADGRTAREPPGTGRPWAVKRLAAGKQALRHGTARRAGWGGWLLVGTTAGGRTGRTGGGERGRSSRVGGNGLWLDGRADGRTDGRAAVPSPPLVCRAAQLRSRPDEMTWHAWREGYSQPLISFTRACLL